MQRILNKLKPSSSTTCTSPDMATKVTGYFDRFGKNFPAPPALARCDNHDGHFLPPGKLMRSGGCLVEDKDAGYNFMDETAVNDPNWAEWFKLYKNEFSYDPAVHIDTLDYDIKRSPFSPRAR